MKVLLTGATGFVGFHTLKALLRAGHSVRAVVPDGLEGLDLQGEHEQVEIVHADLAQGESLEGLAEGCYAVIHAKGIVTDHHRPGEAFENLHVEATRNLITQALEDGVERIVYLSMMGADEHSPAAYLRAKHRAECLVKSCEIPYTIFRPSVIFGPRDGFINHIARLFNPYWRVILLPGGGRIHLQPVSMQDVTEGLVKAVSLSRTASRTYDVGGPERYTLRQLLDLISQAKEVDGLYYIPIPVRLFKMIANCCAVTPVNWITPDQVAMIQQDTTCECRAFFEDFEITAKSLSVKVLRDYLNEQHVQPTQ